MIYLDACSTTQMSKAALDEYNKYASAEFFNPSATYIQAVNVSQALNSARAELKSMLGAKKGDIIFTSGATEANNLAIRGSTREGRWEYVFSAGEHPSVIEVAKAMEREGKIVHFIPLTRSGEVDYDALSLVLSPKTRLVSCMLVSNITGAINDISRISQMLKRFAPQALLHVDGVQAFKKINFSVDELGIDLFSISAHKFHGPKGVGALYVKNKSALKNMVYGGGQEFGIRSGTENVAGVMAMLASAREIDTAKNYKKVEGLKKAFLKEFEDFNKVRIVPGGSPYVVSLIFDTVNGETLVRLLENEVIVGRGSACSSKKAGNSVLESMGYTREQVKGAIRVSFSDTLTEKEVAAAAKIIKKRYLELYERVK